MNENISLKLNQSHYDNVTDAWLHDIWGSSGSDIFAVGQDGVDGIILHYDGTTWSNIPIGITLKTLVIRIQLVIPYIANRLYKELMVRSI